MFKKQPVIDKQGIVNNIAEIKQLIDYCEQHYVDELTIGDITIKRSVHIMPEPKDDKKKQLQDLVSWSSE